MILHVENAERRIKYSILSMFSETQLRVGDHTDAGKCAALWEESEALIGGAIGAE